MPRSLAEPPRADRSHPSPYPTMSRSSTLRPSSSRPAPSTVPLTSSTTHTVLGSGPTPTEWRQSHTSIATRIDSICREAQFAFWRSQILLNATDIAAADRDAGPRAARERYTNAVAEWDRLRRVARETADSVLRRSAAEETARASSRWNPAPRPTGPRDARGAVPGAKGRTRGRTAEESGKQSAWTSGSRKRRSA